MRPITDQTLDKSLTLAEGNHELKLQLVVHFLVDEQEGRFQVPHGLKE